VNLVIQSIQGLWYQTRSIYLGPEIMVPYQVLKPSMVYSQMSVRCYSIWWM